MTWSESAIRGKLRETRQPYQEANCSRPKQSAGRETINHAKTAHTIQGIVFSGIVQIANLSELVTISTPRQTTCPEGTQY